MRKIIYLLFFCIAIGCQPKNNIPISISLHKNWQFKGVDTLDWNTASVPGNVFTDLLSLKIIENPFIKNNEKKAQWVSKKDWEYKTIFKLSKEILNKENIEINFEGLDTYAKIYINGNYQLDTDNAFQKYSIPVKNLLKEENERIEAVTFSTK